MEYSLHFKKIPSTPSSSMFLFWPADLRIQRWQTSVISCRTVWRRPSKKKKQKGGKREELMRWMSLPWVGFPVVFGASKKKDCYMSCNSCQTPWPFFPRHGVRMGSITLSHEWHSRMSDKTTAVGNLKKKKEPSAHIWRYECHTDHIPAFLLATCIHHGSSLWSPVLWQSLRYGRLD